VPSKGYCRKVPYLPRIARKSICKQWWITGWSTESLAPWQKESRRRVATGIREGQPLWVAVIMLSSEMMTTGKRLGKAVGQEVLSFQRRDALLEIQPRMHQQVRAWRIGTKGYTRQRPMEWKRAPLPKGRQLSRTDRA
jgi:hypothetical protein